MGAQNEEVRTVTIEEPETGDGFGYAFRYRDPRSRMYEVTFDRFEAEGVAGDDYEMVLVHFTGGFIDRIVESDSHEGKRPASNDRGSPSFLDDLLAAKASGDSSDGRVSSGVKCPKGGDQREAQHAQRSNCPENGLGLACRYIDPKTGAYGWTSNPEKAKQIAGNDYETVWVRYRHGKIARVATAEEYKGELEVRIGQRISEGLSEVQLNEFDLIDNQAEATRWLERNRPDYRDIVNRTIQEMERGTLLGADKGDRPEP